MRPYLVPAYYAWLVASGIKPHIVVDVNYPGVCVPSGYDEDGRIVLNIDTEAVRNLDIGNMWITFDAIFDTFDPVTIRIPLGAVVLIFAPETSWYVDFSLDAEPTAMVDKPKNKTKKPLFTILPDVTRNNTDEND